MYKVFLMGLLILAFNGCDGNSIHNSSNQRYYEVNEILKVDEVWQEQIPQKYLDLIELYQDYKSALDENIESARDLHIAYTNYLNEYNLHETTYIKIPSAPHQENNISLEVYGIWSGELGESIGCSSSYKGYSVTHKDNNTLQIVLSKSQLYGESACNHELPNWQLLQRDTVDLGTLASGEYRILIINPDGKELRAMMVVE
jgi:hypothetical protein